MNIIIDNMKPKRVITLLISAFIISAIFLTGCGKDTPSPTDTQYVAATATKLGISFSFEYPIVYGKITPDAFEDTGGDPAVSLLYGRPGNTRDKADKQIYIIALDPIESRMNAATWMAEHIRLLENNDPAFKLIERSTIQIGSIDGYVTAYHSSILGNYLSSDYLITWDAYVDYNGYIWKIAVMGIEELAEEE